MTIRIIIPPMDCPRCGRSNDPVEAGMEIDDGNVFTVMIVGIYNCEDDDCMITFNELGEILQT